jgi:hypothetical protein
MSSSNPDGIVRTTNSGVPIPVPLTSPGPVARDWWQIYREPGDRRQNDIKLGIFITTADEFRTWSSDYSPGVLGPVEGSRTGRRWVLRLVDHVGTGTKNVACRTDEDVVAIMTVFKLTGEFEPVASATQKKGVTRVVE